MKTFTFIVFLLVASLASALVSSVILGDYAVLGHMAVSAYLGWQIIPLRIWWEKRGDL